MTLDEQFNTFWQAYPRRVAKGTARTAFAKALRKTSLEAMLQAVADYKQFKPERIDFKHPATWLNAECWDDEWQSVPAETGRKRNFMDVARDRLDGSANISGNSSNVELFPTRLVGPGRTHRLTGTSNG